MDITRKTDSWRMVTSTISMSHVVRVKTLKLTNDSFHTVLMCVCSKQTTSSPMFAATGVDDFDPIARIQIQGGTTLYPSYFVLPLRGVASEAMGQVAH
jgi:hypothetical protein